MKTLGKAWPHSILLFYVAGMVYPKKTSSKLKITTGEEAFSFLFRKSKDERQGNRAGNESLQQYLKKETAASTVRLTASD